MEIARRQAVKEQKKKEKEASGKKPGQLEPEQKEEEEELPPIFIPQKPSPLFCGFYSQPNQFWLSMVHAYSYSQTHTWTYYKCFEAVRSSAKNKINYVMYIKCYDAIFFFFLTIRLLYL